MRPASRGRKGKQNKRSARPAALRTVLNTADQCDCPPCSGADFDPRQLIDELLGCAAGLIESEDPMEAEVVGAALTSICTLAGEGFEEALIDGFIPTLEARATTVALAMLLALGSVTASRASKAAAVAADRLVQAGVAPPRWAGELGEPVTVGDCWRLSDSQGTASMLACSFHRAGRSHAVVISVDHTDCGAAGDIRLLGADDLPGTLDMMMTAGRRSGHQITAQALDAAEFRWQVENALDARAVHDSDDGPDDDTIDLLIDEDGPGYPALAVLTRARMSALPLPGKPAAPHADDGQGVVRLSALQALMQLAGGAGSPLGAAPVALRGRTAVAALPTKRTRSGRPVPVYRIKVGLRGAKPPIWRRLEVAADTSLDQLHTVIQVAFGWDDSHLHVFETPYGEFGIADTQLGHRAEAPVTLEQVAPTANSKIRYTYDFGDDWEHDILVEKVLDPDGTSAYPRCTGGRRAAPPEDCGGMWGYAELVEILNDPDHPEHQDRLEWLGLDEPADFTPDRFDAQAVTRALSGLR